jgi:hypothetical protein
MRAVALLAALAWVAPAWGDGGLVRFSQPTGPFVVTVFSSPTPLRAGPVDLSVLIQDQSGEAVLDARVRLTLMRQGEHPTWVEVAATREQATNKLLYAAPFVLPQEGTWQVDVAIDRNGSEAGAWFTVDAGPPLPPWRAYWFYFMLPVVGIGLYALHQWLVLHRQGAK